MNFGTKWEECMRGIGNLPGPEGLCQLNGGSRYRDVEIAGHDCNKPKPSRQSKFLPCNNTYRRSSLMSTDLEPIYVLPKCNFSFNGISLRGTPIRKNSGVNTCFKI